MKQTMHRGTCKLCGGTFWESQKGARGEDICDDCEQRRENTRMMWEAERSERSERGEK